MGKYLLFDLDGTLYDFDASARIALKKVFEKNSIAYIPEMIRLYEEGNIHCWEEYEKGLISQEELKTKRFQLLFDKLSLHQSAFVAGEDYVTYLAEEGIMIDGALEFLERIKDRDMAIVTNGIARTQHGRMDSTDTKKYFKHIFISQEMGVQKPDKAFFDYVLDVIGKTPEECIMIGDREKSDIAGAINANMESIYLSFDGSNSDKATYNVHSYDELAALVERI